MRHLRRARERAGAQEGFTLVEILVVFLIMAILLSVSVATYASLRTRAAESAAELNVREALSAAELYYAHNDTYTGMTLADLRAMDAGARLTTEPLIPADGQS